VHLRQTPFSAERVRGRMLDIVFGVAGRADVVPFLAPRASHRLDMNTARLHARPAYAASSRPGELPMVAWQVLHTGRGVASSQESPRGRAGIGGLIRGNLVGPSAWGQMALPQVGCSSDRRGDRVLRRLMRPVAVPQSPLVSPS